MRAGLVAAALAGAALLVAALAGVERAAERQPSADLPSPAEMPAVVVQPPDALPSVAEVDDAAGLASPAFTR